MKKSFDDVCKEILGEVSQVSTNPTSAAGGGALTSAQRTVTGSTQTPAEQQKPNQSQQNNTDTNKPQTTTPLKPEEVLKALTQIDPNHPELHTFMDKVTKVLADKQKQAEYNKQAQTNASQTQPTA